MNSDIDTADSLLQPFIDPLYFLTTGLKK